MELGDIGETLRGYEWQCIECKTCEICSEKGDDVRLMSFFKHNKLLYLTEVGENSFL